MNVEKVKSMKNVENKDKFQWPAPYKECKHYSLQMYLKDTKKENERKKERENEIKRWVEKEEERDENRN